MENGTFNFFFTEFQKSIRIITLKHIFNFHYFTFIAVLLFPYSDEHCRHQSTLKSKFLIDRYHFSDDNVHEI